MIFYQFVVYASFNCELTVILIYKWFIRQADNLLERLMLRMGTASSLNQRKYLAFCISELTVTEKGLKKMIELIK